MMVMQTHTNYRVLDQVSSRYYKTLRVAAAARKCCNNFVSRSHAARVALCGRIVVHTIHCDDSSLYNRRVRWGIYSLILLLHTRPIVSRVAYLHYHRPPSTRSRSLKSRISTRNCTQYILDGGEHAMMIRPWRPCLFAHFRIAVLWPQTTPHKPISSSRSDVCIFTSHIARGAKRDAQSRRVRRALPSRSLCVCVRA